MRRYLPYIICNLHVLPLVNLQTGGTADLHFILITPAAGMTRSKAMERNIRELIGLDSKNSSAIEVQIWIGCQFFFHTLYHYIPFAEKLKKTATDFYYFSCGIWSNIKILLNHMLHQYYLHYWLSWNIYLLLYYL